jgi:hypothetical protein
MNLRCDSHSWRGMDRAEAVVMWRGLFAIVLAMPAAAAPVEGAVRVGAGIGKWLYEEAPAHGSGGCFDLELGGHARPAFIVAGFASYFPFVDSDGYQQRVLDFGARVHFTNGTAFVGFGAGLEYDRGLGALLEVHVGATLARFDRLELQVLTTATASTPLAGVGSARILIGLGF